MKRVTKRSRCQLALSLECKAKHELPLEQREALLSALADLLLEALGAVSPVTANEQGEADELQDHV